MPGPVGEIGWASDVLNQRKGVILSASRARRLALAVLAGVLFGLVGAQVASASADVASGCASTQNGSPVVPNDMQPMDWWG
jgi:hypothetical protein